MGHVHESPKTMTVPLFMLAVLSAVGGFIGIPSIFGGSHWLRDYLDPVFSQNSHNRTFEIGQCRMECADCFYRCIGCDHLPCLSTL